MRCFENHTAAPIELYQLTFVLEFTWSTLWIKSNFCQKKQDPKLDENLGRKLELWLRHNEQEISFCYDICRIFIDVMYQIIFDLILVFISWKYSNSYWLVPKKYCGTRLAHLCVISKYNYNYNNN